MPACTFRGCNVLRLSLTVSFFGRYLHSHRNIPPHDPHMRHGDVRRLQGRQRAQARSQPTFVLLSSSSLSLPQQHAAWIIPFFCYQIFDFVLNTLVAISVVVYPNTVQDYLQQLVRTFSPPLFHSFNAESNPGFLSVPAWNVPLQRGHHVHQQHVPSFRSPHLHRMHPLLQSKLWLLFRVFYHTVTQRRASASVDVLVKRSRRQRAAGRDRLPSTSFPPLTRGRPISGARGDGRLQWSVQSHHAVCVSSALRGKMFLAERRLRDSREITVGQGLTLRGAWAFNVNIRGDAAPDAQTRGSGHLLGFRYAPATC